MLGPQLGFQQGAMGWVATPALNRLHRQIITTAAAALHIGRGHRVADIGYGGGLGLGLLLDAVGPTGTVHGVEISDLTIRRARLQFRSAVRQGRLRLHQASVTDLPLPDGSLDAVMTVNTIHHFEDLAAAFASVSRVLAPGGRVAVGFPDPTRQRTNPATIRHEHRVRDVDEVRSELTRAGLSDVTSETTRGGVYVVLTAAKPGTARFGTARFAAQSAAQSSDSGPT